MSLSRTVIHSGLWLQTSKLLQLAANFIVTAILARLLNPEDFGLVGIVFIYTTFITLFTRVGFGYAIIQHQDATRQQISTLFWLNCIFGLFTTGIVAGTASLASRFYEYEALVPLIQVISVNFLISPLYRLHRKMMEKELLFHRLAKIDIMAAVASGLVGVGCAFWGFEAYSLVFQSISFNVFGLVGVRLAFRWNPAYAFSWKNARQMIYFSLKMKGAHVTRYFERNIDLFILGKMLPVEVFGFYSLANRIIYFPLRRIANTFTDILFPSFSRIQADLQKIKIGYLKTIQLIAIFIFPFILLIALYARPLVLFVFGQQWLPIVKVLFILAAVGAVQSIEILSVIIFPAINRPEVSFKLGIIQVIVTGIASYIGSLYGLTGAAVAILIAKSLLFVISLAILKYYIKFTFSDVLKYLAGPLLGMGGIVLAFAVFHTRLDYTLPELVAALAASMIVYSLLILLTNFRDLKYIFVRLVPKRENVKP